MERNYRSYGGESLRQSLLIRALIEVEAPLLRWKMLDTLEGRPRYGEKMFRGSGGLL